VTLGVLDMPAALRPMALLLCAIALVGGGCGDGDEEKDEYVKKFKPLNERLVAVSQQISESLAGAEGIETLGVKFDLQIVQLETVNRNIENLDTPEDLRDESAALTRSVRASVATLREISTAVREGKQAKAASAAVELASRAQAANRAQERMTRATGLKSPRAARPPSAPCRRASARACRGARPA
jgi:hypothetical protein